MVIQLDGSWINSLRLRAVLRVKAKVLWVFASIPGSIGWWLDI